MIARELNDAEIEQIQEVREFGQALIDLCNNLGKSRELSLAITNTEQAVMWAEKHIMK